MAPQKVLITGASGFIGQALCRYLHSKGYQVRALTRASSAWMEPKGIERVVGDMQDLESLRAATAGVDWVAHLAAAKSDEADSDKTNVLGARNLVDACRSNGVGFIVNVSTQSAKLQLKGRYALTKHEADEAFRGSGFPVTTLRSSLVYGDLTGGVFGSLVKFAQWPVVPVMGAGTAPHWPIHVEDLGRAIEIAALRPKTRGQIYEVGGPDRASTNQLLDYISERSGRRSTRLHVPIWLGLLLAKVFSILPRPPFTRSNVLGSNEHVSMDVERFFRDFEFTPRPLAQGLKQLFEASR
jgi:NADH dehydrogenase